MMAGERGDAMPTTLRARYADGVLTPLEPLDLADGCEVTVSIDAEPRPRGAAAVLELARRAHASAPPDTEDGFPADFAMNKKHYLYGYPKDEGA